MATVTSVFQETEYYVWIELRPGEETDSFVEEFKTNPETAWEQLYKDLVENNIGAWAQICNGDYIEGQQDLVGERIQIIPPSTILDVELYEAIPDISPNTTGFDIDVETAFLDSVTLLLKALFHNTAGMKPSSRTGLCFISIFMISVFIVYKYHIRYLIVCQQAYARVIRCFKYIQFYIM